MWCEDVKVWRSRSADVRVWRCRSADVKVWRCRSADVKVWRCRSADVRVWRCRSAGVRVWRCRSADVRVWRCRSADVMVWRCRSADVRVWRCRSADVRVWRCRSADVKVWRSRSADVRVWRCRSGDVKVWRCRSADVKVWRSRSADVSVWRCTTTAAFLRRTLRRRFREKTVRSQSQPPASPNMSCRKLSYSSELVIACGLPWWWLESNHWNRMDTWRFCLSSCSMTYYLAVWTMNGNSRSNLQIYSSLCQRLWSTHGLVWKYSAQNLMVYHCLSCCVLYFKFPDKS